MNKTVISSFLSEDKISSLNVGDINSRFYGLIKNFNGDQLKKIREKINTFSSLGIKIEYLKGQGGAKIEFFKYKVIVLLGLSNIEIIINNSSKDFRKDELLKSIENFVEFLGYKIEDMIKDKEL